MCIQKKTKPTPISAQLSPMMRRPTRNIKWRSSSKQCNSFLFPLFLPLFPALRLRRRRRFESLIVRRLYTNTCAVCDAVRGLLLTIKIPLLYRRHCWQQRAKNVKRQKTAARVPFFTAKINCDAHS